MRLFEKVADLKSYLNNKGPIGFVPTMGALHAGHSSLISESKKSSALTVCSIFVNPTQFNNLNDLKTYPRTLEQDCKLLEQLDCDVVFAPSEDEVYPNGQKELLEIDFGHLDTVMEGKFRPSHFKGVATVVKRLFEIVEPQYAYFGRKDYQQLLIIKAMTEKFHLPLQIIGCEVVRAENGLALSSRNALLSADEKLEASGIYRILKESKKWWEDDITPNEISKRAIEEFSKTSLKLEYFELFNAETLLPVKSKAENVIACTAAYCGKVRLIDNLFL